MDIVAGLLSRRPLPFIGSARELENLKADLTTAQLLEKELEELKGLQ